MGRIILRTSAILSALAAVAYVATRWLRTHRAHGEYGLREPALSTTPLSGPGLAVDHDRQPGVPPSNNDDYDDPTDRTDADSFPASDPPGGW